MFAAFQVPFGWGELLKRTVKDANQDDVLGLAAQLAYYFFLALFPAVLFVLALASFFPVANFADEVTRALGPVAPPDVLRFLDEQMRRISGADSGGILTLGILGAIWSSSAAVVAIIGSLNRAYDIEEGRPWWKVRIVAVGLTLALAILVLLSFSLIVAGPTAAEYLARTFGLGPVFEWTWKIVQWPIAFLLVSTALGLVYYFAPDAEQDWVWITPGALVGTFLWVVVSLVFKFYAVNFGDYNATYGAVGGVVVLLLWFYISAIAVLAGAELNAEIEHASPYGKAPGEKVAGQRKKIGVLAAREYAERMRRRESPAALSLPPRPELPVSREHKVATNIEDRSVKELFAELSREGRTLVQQELALAKVELKEKAVVAGMGAVWIVAGGLVAYGGVLALIAGLVLALIAFGLPAWAGAAVGGVLAGIVGYLLIRAGVASLKPEALVPRQTLDTLKENVRWLKRQMS